MRRILLLLLFALSLSPVWAARKVSHEWAHLLQSMSEQCSVHPDSLYPHIQRLEARVALCADSTERAIGKALLGYLYQQCHMQGRPTDYSSQADSTEMQGWTREDWYRQSVRCYADALSHPDLLHRARLSDWAPLLQKGNRDHWYQRDLLALVWRSAQTIPLRFRQSLPSRAYLINYYRQKGLREGALWLALEAEDMDSLTLVRLKDEYSNEPLNAKTYLYLSQREAKPTLAMQWVEEGLARYRKSPYASLLLNRKEQLEHPYAVLRNAQEFYSPHHSYSWQIEGRNIQHLRWTIYRLRDAAQVEACQQAKDIRKYLKAHARLVESCDYYPTSPSTYLPFTDSIHWTAPEAGPYVVLLSPTALRYKGKYNAPSYDFFTVTRMAVHQIDLPEGKRRVVVNDQLTGAPLQGVQVDYFRLDEGSTDTLFLAHQQTDAKGVTDLLWENIPQSYRNEVRARVRMPQDDAYPSFSLYYYRYNFRDSHEATSRRNVRLYTDRALYRPGQTVHVGGIVYQAKDWDERVEAGYTTTLSLLDAQGKEVAQQEVTSDSMGVISADFVLPSTGLTGRFTLRTPEAYETFRVEEYKRPTFEVKTDEAPALQMPADSITLTGRALHYNGTPVRGARVVTRYRWVHGLRSWYRYVQGYTPYKVLSDTVQTNAQGTFAVTIPLPQGEKKAALGRFLNVQYDVLSPEGEMHSAEQRVMVNERPLMLYTEVPPTVDRDQLKPWRLLLTTSTGRDVEGEVQVRVSRQGQSVMETRLQSGTQVLPQFVRDLPSGRYRLDFQTILKGDTATSHADLVVFSQHDTRLAVDTTLWVYAPHTTFGPGQVARVQIGSSRDAYIYYTLMSRTEVVEDRLLHLQDSVLTLDIPYEERYDKGLTLNLMMVHDHEMYSQTVYLKLVTPDKQLQPKWTTFRDRLLPGQQETWQLQLLRPDGTPASANLMATLYDASLDALQGHEWSFTHSFNHWLNPTRYRKHYRGQSLYVWATFVQPQHKEPVIDFAHWRDALFFGGEYDDYVAGHGGGILKSVPVLAKSSALRRETRSVRIRGTQPVEAFEGLAEVNLQGKIAGLSLDTNDTMLNVVSATEATDAEEALPDPIVPLRANFAETAFFYPALHTNARGEVSLSFTLPESLTTWRLLGLAHTSDLLTAQLNQEVVAQKDLMAQLSLPRYLRQGDKASLGSSLSNVSGMRQAGRAVLTVLDAATDQVLLKRVVRFDLEAARDTTYHFAFEVPEGAGQLICRWVAESATCSDGEQRYLPVLSHKEWITETRVLTFAKAGTYTENLRHLFKAPNATQRQFTFEYVSQPLWYAVQSLPTLAWPKHDDVLSLATAYYAGSLSGSLLQQYPRLQEAMRQESQRAEAAKGQLAMNEEVKNLVLNETPWAADALREAQRKQRLATLFDSAMQESLQKTYLDRLRALQQSDGSFVWYPGMQGSPYLTREVAYLLTRMKRLTGKAPDRMIQQAVGYLRQDKPTELSTSSLRYLYVLYQSGVQMERADRRNADSLLRALAKHPEDLNLEERALAAIVLDKAGKKKDAQRYLQTVKQFLVTNGEGLTYFEFPQGSFRSIDRKLHIHVQVMEAVQQLTPQDTTLLKGMRRYLLRAKRTQDWDTPVDAANAIYALMLDRSTAWAMGSDAVVSVSGKRVHLQAEEDSTALGRVRLHAEADTPLQDLVVVKKGEQESWGSLYAQYLAPLSEVQASGAALQVRQEVPTKGAKVGDRLYLRYVITATQDCEYVALQVPRSAAVEPAQPLSGYQWRNGLAYYRAVKDASTTFFFDHLPRGTYVLEEEVLVERPGEYSTGVARLQCLYAPEFAAHSSEVRIEIEDASR